MSSFRLGTLARGHTKSLLLAPGWWVFWPHLIVDWSLTSAGSQRQFCALKHSIDLLLPAEWQLLLLPWHCYSRGTAARCRQRPRLGPCQQITRRRSARGLPGNNNLSMQQRQQLSILIQGFVVAGASGGAAADACRGGAGDMLQNI